MKTANLCRDFYFHNPQVETRGNKVSLFEGSSLGNNLMVMILSGSNFTVHCRVLHFQVKI